MDPRRLASKRIGRKPAKKGTIASRSPISRTNARQTDGDLPFSRMKRPELRVYSDQEEAVDNTGQLMVRGPILTFGQLLSAIWLAIAWALHVSIIGMLVGFWMFNRVPAVVTLARS